jgi:hypothetical protein
LTRSDSPFSNECAADGSSGRLTLHLDGPLPPVPTRERRHNSLGVVRCTNKVVTLNREIDELLLLKPGPGPIYPGALVPVNAALAGDRPALMAPAAAQALHLLVGGRSTGIRCHRAPEPDALCQALPALLSAWIAAGSTGPPEPPERLSASVSWPTLLCSKAYDLAQLSLDLAMAPAWASPALRGHLEPGDPREGQHSTVVARLQQVQYSVVLDAPIDTRPGAGAARAEAAGCGHPAATGEPPCAPLACVQRVDYGRTVFVKMQTRGSPMRMDAEAALRLALGDRRAAGGASTRHERIAAQSSFTVLVVGEGGEGLLRIEQPAGPAALQALLASPTALDPQAPAGAIACRLRLLNGWRPLSLLLSLTPCAGRRCS